MLTVFRDKNASDYFTVHDPKTTPEIPLRPASPVASSPVVLPVPRTDENNFISPRFPSEVDNQAQGSPLVQSRESSPYRGKRKSVSDPGADSITLVSSTSSTSSGSVSSHSDDEDDNNASSSHAPKFVANCNFFTGLKTGRSRASSEEGLPPAPSSLTGLAAIYASADASSEENNTGGLENNSSMVVEPNIKVLETAVLTRNFNGVYNYLEGQPKVAKQVGSQLLSMLLANKPTDENLASTMQIALFLVSRGAVLDLEHITKIQEWRGSPSIAEPESDNDDNDVMLTPFAI